MNPTAMSADEMREAKHLLEQGHSYSDVGRILGRAHSTIARRLPGYHYSPSFRRDREIAELTRQGLPRKEIARRLRVTTRTVSRARMRSGLGKEPAPPITADELARAKVMLEDGASYQEVERTIGRCAVSIKKHLPGYTWTPQQCSAHRMNMRAFNRIARATRAQHAHSC